MISRRVVAVVVLVLAAGCGPAAVRQVEPPAVVLRPGAAPAAVPAPGASPQRLPVCPRSAVACVSRAHRQAWLQRDGRVTYGPVPVSLGGPGHRTPRGSFRVAWKDAEHTSSTYGIDMPWSVFFAHGGIAFHEGPLDESSHGCVHLGPAAAERFFAELERGDRVNVL